MVCAITADAPLYSQRLLKQYALSCLAAPLVLHKIASRVKSLCL